MSNQQGQADTFDLGDRIKLGVAAGVLAVFALFFALNWDKVEVDLVVVKPDLPLAIAMVISAVLGLVIGLLLGLLRGKSASR